MIKQGFKFSMLIVAVPLLSHGKESDIIAKMRWSYQKVDSQTAKSVYQESEDIVVAIIDTGIDTKHPALKSSLWVNPGETGQDRHGKDKRTNGIDDDQNGFIDDVHGWNFANNSNDIADSHGHGTHVSGIIASEKNIISKVEGVAPTAKLMVIKYYEEECKTCSPLKATIEGIKYAIKMKADIINYSSGGSEYHPRERQVIQQAIDSGIVFVAAAGNNSQDSDKVPYYPADYDIPGLISVAAIAPNSSLAKISNFGKKSVDIAAPGEQIYSTLPGYSAGFMTGTSQATAFVSGVAALALSHRGDLKADPERLKRHLLSTGTTQKSLKNATRSGRVVNSFRALVMAGTVKDSRDVADDIGNSKALISLAQRMTNDNTQLGRGFSSLSPSPLGSADFSKQKQ